MPRPDAISSRLTRRATTVVCVGVGYVAVVNVIPGTGSQSSPKPNSSENSVDSSPILTTTSPIGWAIDAKKFLIIESVAVVASFYSFLEREDSRHCSFIRQREKKKKI